MAAKAPERPLGSVDGQESNNSEEQAPITAPLASETPRLPEGFVRLSETRRKQTGDAYAALRPFVGKVIQLDGVSIAADGKSGKMEFSEFREEGWPEGVDVPTFSCPIPKGALKAIIAAGQAHPEETIVTEVVQTKRGMALR